MVTINIEDRHLIDRYLQDDISGIELQNFLLRLKKDEVFARQVETQKLIYAGVQKANHDNLKHVIITSIDYRKPVIPNALKLIVTFLVITVIGISLWFYVGNETANRDQSNSWFAFLKNKNKDDHLKASEEKINPLQKQKVQVAEDTFATSNKKEISIGDTSSSENQNASSVTDSVQVNSDENIVVKQDQLLISTTIPVEDKNESKRDDDESLSKETVEQLNPAADLPDNEKPPSAFVTEFWVSPINYRGYKMSKNKLVLFGIEEPDAVKLYRVNDGIYMSYLREYYKLTDTFDFISYQKLKEAEIPLAIR